MIKTQTAKEEYLYILRILRNNVFLKSVLLYYIYFMKGVHQKILDSKEKLYLRQ